MVKSPRQTAPADRLRIARFLADLLDQRFTIPGTQIRIGLDPIIGLIPGVGDVVANLAGSVILFIAAQYGLPKIVLLRMGLNIAVNAIIGGVPIFGDLFSIWFRSNARNAALLERYARGETRGASAGDWFFVIGLIVAVLAVIAALVFTFAWLAEQLWNSL
ncbi:MAG TPA: DUF4112 domain-containing protein [Candidatus Binatia bacterium]|nr:DUF4112 domain-containing protein [Candidatus Binatia bacterium]